jgi:lambda repressor-like predicted transcriptional regulator
MHPEQIKAELRMRGTSASGVADSMNRSRAVVSNVIHSRTKSRRIATLIAAIIERSVDDIWPGRYPAPKGKRRPRRRPT